MLECSVLELLWQLDSRAAGEAFRELIGVEIRGLIVEAMAREVTALCGPAYRPRPGSAYRRGGSAAGRVVLGGRREMVRRPRVVREGAGGCGEARLASYEAARNGDHVRDGILRALAAVVALGISTDGTKRLLDFEIGASESAGVCDLLMARLIRRGLSFAGPPLVILDGSKALRTSVTRHCPHAHVQRCLVHKERNIRATLSRRWHGRLSGLFNRLRAVQGIEAAMEVVAELRAFLAEHSRKALDSLDEAGDDLLTLHRLGCPSTLNASLLSTNAIENPFRNVRARIGRVKRWRAATDQAERWLGYGLMEAEKGFRRIRGYRDIGLLLRAMDWPPDACQASLRSALAPPGHPFGDGRSSTTPGPGGGSEATSLDRKESDLH